MRNNNPVEELRCHLKALKVNGIPGSELKLEDVELKIGELPLKLFHGGDL